MKTTEQLGEWLVEVIKGIVEFPAEVVITHETDGMGVKYDVKVAKTDAGKVIGMGGRNADALRTILRSAGFQSNIRASMFIVIPGERHFEPEDIGARAREYHSDLHDARKRPGGDYQE